MDNNIFKALVIDDDAGRNAVYHSVLDRRFDTEIVNDFYQINTKVIRQYDLLIIDVCLSKRNKELTAFQIIKDYNITAPVVLISGEWVRNNGEPNDDILLVPTCKNVIKIISWNSFIKKENAERIAEEIYYDYCKVRNISTDVRKDKCVILHLSDLQFGGNTAGAACNDNNRLVSFLKLENINPDLIVITGDIADKGMKKEYNEAKIWIEQLIKELWNIKDKISNEYRQRIIMVPGNHDYDVSVCASDVFSFSFGKNEIDAFVQNSADNVVFSHQKLGFKNYFDFVSDLLGVNSWSDYEKRAVKINEHFLSLGICFVLFNSVYNINTRNCENKHDLFYCNLSELSRDDLEYKHIINDHVINILVMHNPPENYHSETASGQNSTSVFRSLVEDNHIKLCFYGHSHDSVVPHEWNDNGSEYCEHMICVSAPTYRLAAASRTEDAMRGFNIIELSGDSNKKFDSVNVKCFEAVKANIVLKKEKSFSLN